MDVLAAPPPGAAIHGNDFRRISVLLSAAKAAYPLVVADLPPALHASSRGVLELAEQVYVVCTPEITSVHLARRRANELMRIGVEQQRLRLVLNRAGSHAWIGAGEVSQAVRLPVSALVANDYAALNRAVLEGGVVPYRSALGRQFEELGRRVLGGRVGARAATAASA
jgi:Flp pilus assembly CpaE family ATPase